MDEQVKGNFFTKKKIIIILAIIILAGLIYWLDQLGAFSEKKFALRVQSALESLQPNPEKMPAITADDHILGDTKLR